jgi:transcriptional regulator of acetoin/glycerol metabolism
VPHQLMEEVTTDARLRVWLSSPRRQQHLLVQCPRRRLDQIASQVMNFAAGPVRRCLLPGALALQSSRTGSLLIYDVAALTLNQQIVLFDWLGAARSDVRVVAVTAQPVGQLVESGAFLEGLFHRLGSVLLQVVGDQPDAISQSFEARSTAEKAGVC